MSDPTARYRIHVTLATATILGIAGLFSAWSIQTPRLDERIADILTSTLGLAVLGALFGYVISSVYYRRMSLVDAFVCFAIPVFTFIGFAFGTKPGDEFRFSVFSYVVMAMIVYLGFRVCKFHISQRKATIDNSATDPKSHKS